MYTLPMIVSMLLVLVFFGALLYFVRQIAALLETIGGKPTSYLAKLRLGLRAIETETAHLPRGVVALNADLGAIAEGLGAVDGHLGGTLEAAGRQGGEG